MEGDGGGWRGSRWILFCFWQLVSGCCAIQELDIRIVIRIHPTLSTRKFVTKLVGADSFFARSN